MQQMHAQGHSSNATTGYMATQLLALLTIQTAVTPAGKELVS